ncbi:MAG TPA: APC family permease [Streptosporangiaceae bacterium]|nr:APC family permease [Streptosporangiaceae bacterium]
MTTDRVQDPGAAPGAAPATAAQPRLRRNLGSWQVLGVSLGVMGLSLSANLNPQGAEPSVGRAIPLAFLISAIAVLLLSHSFVRLSQHFNTAGSVFGFVGATLGARAGAVAGWCLLGGYLIFGAGSCYAAAVFFNSLLENLGVSHPAQWLPYLVTLVLLAVATGVTVIPARRGTDLLLIFEACTVLLILIISIVVLIKITTHGGPQGQHFTMSVFTPATGVSPSSLFLGTVFGILAFVGFEGAATMGEEAREPRRSIPRAIFGTVLIGGAFYVLTAAVEVMGYGADKAGLARFEASGSLFGGLGSTYISSWVGDVVTIGTMVSALAGAIGCVVGSSRMIYAMARSSRRPANPLLRVSARFGTPVGAIGAAFAIMALSAVAFGWVLSTSIFNAWAWTGEVGTLIVLVAYLLAMVGELSSEQGLTVASPAAAGPESS